MFQTKKGLLNSSGSCPLLLPFKSELLPIATLSLQFFPVNLRGAWVIVTPTAFVTRLGTRGSSRLPGHVPLFIGAFPAAELVSVRVSASVPAVPFCLFPSLLSASLELSHQDCLLCVYVYVCVCVGVCVCVCFYLPISLLPIFPLSLWFSLCLSVLLPSPGVLAIDGVMPRGPVGPEMPPQEPLLGSGREQRRSGCSGTWHGVSRSRRRQCPPGISGAGRKPISVWLCGGVQTAGAWSASS